jgi:hypothetical protein
MKTLLTKAGAAAFKTRWVAVNKAERKELRATAMSRKFWQLAALMTSVNQLGWTDPLAQGTSEVRTRWNRLRKARRLA